MPFVKDSAIPQARNEYVCWIDIMGTKSKMENSVNTCAIFMWKISRFNLRRNSKKEMCHKRVSSYGWSIYYIDFHQ